MSKILRIYLRFWAKRYLKRASPEIIAITGSVGKTSTKDAIFEVLKTKFGKDIRRSEGNLNNETGVPAAILDFKKAPSHEATNPFGWITIILKAPFRSFLLEKKKILVLELAADKPGDIKYLISFIKPKIAVLTSIGPAHLAEFGSVEAVAEEKANLIKVLPFDGTAILNIDDANIRKLSYGGRWKVLTYSISEASDFQAKDVRTRLFKFEASTTFLLKTQKEDFLMKLHSFGREANVYPALAAIACGSIYSISLKSIAEALEKLSPGHHRMEILKGKKNTTLIDDCYNANPLSMKAALGLLKELKAKRKIAVLGEMAELGRESLNAHLEIGKIARQSANQIYAVGKWAKRYQSKKWFPSAHVAASYILNDIKPGDIILIKGSRSVGLEEVVEELRK